MSANAYHVFCAEFKGKLKTHQCPIKMAIAECLDTLNFNKKMEFLIDESCVFAGLPTRKIPTFLKNLNDGAGDESLSLAVYFYLHANFPGNKHVLKIDRVSFDGETYFERTGKHVVNLSSNLDDTLRRDNLEPNPDPLSDGILNSGQLSKPKGSDPNLRPLVIVEPDADGSNWLSPFNLKSISRQCRDNELAQLGAFANAPEPYRLWALIASSGAGKTRLAAEWMHRCREDHCWNVGFLGDPNPDIWDNWHPYANTIIAVDYIHNYGRAIKAILNRCKSLHNHGVLETFKVRILVIDHVFPKRFADILRYSHWNEIFEDKIALDAWNQVFDAQDASGSKKSVFFDQRPLRLAQAQDRNTLLRRVIADVGGKLATDDERVEAAMRTLNRMEDAAQHPLFAALIGDAIFNGRKDYRNWTRLELIDYYLDSKNRLPWEQKDKPLGFLVGVLVASATVRGGTDVATLFDCLPQTIRRNGDQIEISDYGAQIDGQYTHITSSPTLEGWFEAFRPDILGEFFVLLFIGKIQLDKAGSELFIKLLTAYGINKNGEDNGIAMVGFFKRLARNLCNYDQNTDRIKVFWANLDAFLNVSIFTTNETMRCLLAIVRFEIFRELIIQKDFDRAVHFFDKISIYDLESSVDFWLSRGKIILLFSFQRWNLKLKGHSQKLDDFIIRVARNFEDTVPGPQSVIDIAMELEYNNIIPLIVNKGLIQDKSNQGRDYATTLSLAAHYGYFDVVKDLVENGIDPNSISSNGSYALLLAAEQNYTSIVDILLDRKEICVNQIHGIIGTFPLLKAAHKGHTYIVKALLSKNEIDVNMFNRCNGSFPLLQAAQEGHTEVVEALLQKEGIEVNKTHDFMGVFPLLLAAQNGHAPVVSLLLNSKSILVNMVHDDDGTFALQTAALWGRKSVVELLLTHPNINVDKRVKKTNFTALMHASQFGYEDVLVCLLQAHADPNIVSKDYGTALDMAIQQDFQSVAALLVDWGAKTEADLMKK